MSGKEENKHEGTPKTDKKLSVLLQTYGCQMNEYDSDQAAEMLKAAGFLITNDEGHADVVVLNTCSVRQHAEDRVFNKLYALSKRKQRKQKNLIIGLMGCMANAYKSKLLKQFPALDFIVGTRDSRRIVNVVENALSKRKQEAFVNDEYHAFSYSDYFFNEGSLKAYVPVMRGCNNFCTYCIVPYVRGREISRPSQDVYNEVLFLASKGVKEIILLGQNVNSYGIGLDEKINFSALLNLLSQIDGVEIIRFMTSHPKDVSDELFETMSNNIKVEKHIHLPLQSGSNAVLAAMNRNYSVESYRNHILKLRELIPNVMLTTDMIVGFCGENQKNFDETIEFIKEIQFDNAFIFKYSPRTGTKAFDFENNVSVEEKNERHKIMFELQKEISFNKYSSVFGTVERVLVDSKSKKDKSFLKGTSVAARGVVFKGSDNMIGSMVPVRLKSVVANTFTGEIVNE